MTCVAEIRPAADTETALAGLLADVLGVERVAPESHFFDDLGADSMTMAQFCARVRKRAELHPVSMKDIYRNPTIRALVRALDAAPPPVEPRPRPVAPAPRVGTAQVVLCGALQVLFVAAWLYLVAAVGARGYAWIGAAPSLLDLYARAVVFGAAALAAGSALPILAKWALVGRWTPQEIPIWSLAYVRFWVVRTLIRTGPPVRFVGSPLYVLYLRALGARIGRNVLILSREVPVCTDLLTLGAGAVVRKNAFFNGYRARAGVIETGAVTLGRDAVVGEGTVLDIDTALGDGARLGHASTLTAGQRVPDGETWHGTPAQRRAAGGPAVASLPCGPGRQAAYVAAELALTLLVGVPLLIGGVHVLVVEGIAGAASGGLAGATPVADALAVSSALFFGLVLAGLVVALTVPRLLNLMIRPDTDHPLYGVRYFAHRAIARLTNIAFYPRLFGDSSFIVPYLQALGYRLSPVRQTGTNFGLEVRHDTPFLVSVGTGTMAADGLSLINADYSGTAFRVSRVTVGAQSFLGNYVAYPAAARTGDDCLLATKLAVPDEGPMRTGVGLLGSPSFEIPRTVARDLRFDHLARGDEFRRRLGAKNRHNAVTIGLYLLTCWLFAFELAVVALLVAALYPALGAAAPALGGLLALGLSVCHFVLAERLSTMFRPLQPQYCSIYEPYFWSHERYWKLSTQPSILDGTPLKGLAWRLLGVRIGARVFDDGCILMEKTLIAIGDDCVLNAGSIIQGHSQEDGTFKSDRIAIGAGCTLGVGALVHYGATVGDGAELGPNAFLMKGEDVPAHARWGGNPAHDDGGESRARRWR